MWPFTEDIGVHLDEMESPFGCLKKCGATHATALISSGSLRDTMGLNWGSPMFGKYFNLVNICDCNWKGWELWGSK